MTALACSSERLREACLPIVRVEPCKAVGSPENERFERFYRALRRESARGPGRGLGRLTRLVRGGAGLAARMLKDTRRTGEFELSERDLDKLEELVTRLGELKGLPMKFGQLLSYLELDMPPEGRRLLSLLQTQSSATAFERVERVMREDLGPRAEELLEKLERDPVSVASIGQVYRARLHEGRDVAVKVRHPDIEEAIRSDFRVANLGTALARAIPGMGVTAAEFVAEMRSRLLEECDYALEATRQQLFGSIYAGHPVLVVPEVYPEYCGPRVLTTNWESGRDFEEFCGQATQQERDHAGAALFDFYLGTLYRRGVFHADPHPGNYHFRRDGRVVVFDYGCVRVFPSEAVRALVALADAVRADDRGRMCRALSDLGAEPSSNDAAFAHLRGLLRSFFGPMLVNGPRRIEERIVIDMKQIMRDKLAIAKLRLPGRFLFLFRIRFGLYAVLSRLGSVCDWASLEQHFAEESALLNGVGPE